MAIEANIGNRSKHSNRSKYLFMVRRAITCAVGCAGGRASARPGMRKRARSVRTRSTRTHMTEVSKLGGLPIAACRPPTLSPAHARAHTALRRRTEPARAGRLRALVGRRWTALRRRRRPSVTDGRMAGKGPRHSTNRHPGKRSRSQFGPTSAGRNATGMAGLRRGAVRGGSRGAGGARRSASRPPGRKRTVGDRW